MDDLETLAEALRSADTAAALTGAGVSAPSGVPTFRGARDRTVKALGVAGPTRELGMDVPIVVECLYAAYAVYIIHAPRGLSNMKQMS